MLLLRSAPIANDKRNVTHKTAILMTPDKITAEQKRIVKKIMPSALLVTPSASKSGRSKEDSNTFCGDVSAPKNGKAAPIEKTSAKADANIKIKVANNCFLRFHSI